MKIISRISYIRIVFIALALIATGCASQNNAPPPADFNGMWFVTEYDEIQRPDDGTPPYTPEAKQKIDTYKANFDPVTESAVNVCNTIGMPWTMLARARDYPREIYQTDDRILMFFEYMDQLRTIYLDRDTVPENWAGSNQGYSLGRWENNQLIIETTGFSESSEASSMQRSDQAKTIERWTRYQHPIYGDVIEIKLEVIDPLVYKEVRYGRALWRLGSDETVINSYGCPATVWEEFVIERMNK